MTRGSEKAINPFLPVIRELDARNAPVYVEMTSSELYAAFAEVYWSPSDEHQPVGTLKAVGTGNKPLSYTLRTDRIDYIFRKREPKERVIKYKRLDGLVNGLIKYSIPLKPEEQRELKLAALKKKLDFAQHTLYGHLGHCHVKVGQNAEAVIDHLLFGRTTAKLEELIDELEAHYKNLKKVREEYEQAIQSD
jgi:hypothetical protein